MTDIRPGDAERRRIRTLSAVMVAVLGVSIAIAWVLAGIRGAPTRTGAEIMEQIRRDGLAAHWRHRPPEQWHLISAGEKPIGWRAALMRSVPTGGFEGLDVKFRVLTNTWQVQWETWTLDAYATEGKYRAGIIVPRQGRPLAGVDTVIALREGRVLVDQAKFGHSEADAPANYIPEGVRDLAVYLAAQGGEPAGFRMVFNEMPPSGGRVQSGRILVEDMVSSADGWQVTVRSSGGSEETVSYDNRGQVVRRQHDGGKFAERPAELKEVVAAFPAALAMMRQVSKESGFVLASPVEPDERDDD